MNWLSWRQFRRQALAGYGALAAMGAFLILTGLVILHAYNQSGLAACFPTGGQACADLGSAFSHRFNSMQFVVLFLLMVPVLVGMFWGAPLVARELEHGTHRLAWTQSVSRRRWITSKLAIVGGATLAFSALLNAAVYWWSRPLVATGWSTFEPGIFDLRGIAPVAYTMFALALGVALGAMFRKTLPAVFATLAVFAAVRLSVILLLRKHYMAAKTVLFDMKSGTRPPHMRGDWILSSNTIDRAGHVVSNFGGLDFLTMSKHCPELLSAGPEPTKELFQQCVDKVGLRLSESYHPISRIWTFQAIESAIFLALTALLVVYIIRRVKRVS